MGTLKDMKRHPPKILLIGDYGTGKTALGLTLGKRLRVLDVDNGLLTGKTFVDKFTPERKEVDVKACWEEDPEKALAFDKTLSYAMSFGKELKAGTASQSALMVDSFTSLFQMSLNAVLYANGRLGKAPEIQDWNIANIQIEKFLLVLRTLPAVVIMTAHVQRAEQDGDLIGELACPGRKLPPRIPTYFDEIWIATVKNIEGGKRKYVLQTQSTRAMKARTRANLEDGTDQDLGMVEILRRMGHDIDVLMVGEKAKNEGK